MTKQFVKTQYNSDHQILTVNNTFENILIDEVTHSVKADDVDNVL